MAHNTGPPMCKVCGHPHRWVDDHIWGIAAAAEKTGGGKRGSVLPAAVLDKTLEIKKNRLAVEAEAKASAALVPKQTRRDLATELIAREVERKEKQRARVAKFRAKRADFRHQGR